MKLPRENYKAKSTASAAASVIAMLREAGFPPHDCPPLQIGDRCRLIGYRARLLVVEVNPFMVAIEHKGRVFECEIPRDWVERAA